MHTTTISMHQSDLKRRILDSAIVDKHYLKVKYILQKKNV
jgi:hypothetical protein